MVNATLTFQMTAEVHQDVPEKRCDLQNPGNKTI